MPCQTVSSCTYSVIPPVSVCVAGWLDVFYVGIHVSVHVQADCAVHLNICRSVCLSIRLSSHCTAPLKSMLQSVPCPALQRWQEGLCGALGNSPLETCQWRSFLRYVTPVAAVGSLLYALFSDNHS